MILQLETAMKTCSVSLSDKGKTIAIRTSHPTGFEHSEKLNVLVEELMTETKISFKDLQAVCVSSGPGSYTGLRIGVASAKGFCFALDIPLLAIDTLEIMMQCFKNSKDFKESDYYIPMIDARRMEVYQSIYNKSLKLINPPEAVIIDENSFDEINGKVLIFGEGADKLSNLNLPKNVVIASDFKTSSSGMSFLAYQKFTQKDFEDLAYFDPIYLKEFQTGSKAQ